MAKLMIGAAIPEERAFAADVNKRLADGVTVHPFERAPADGEREWCLTFQYGTRRHTISSESPWHYDSPDEVVRRVMDWVARAHQANRWTTSLEAADGEM